MREEADGLGLLKTTPRPYRMGLGLCVCCSRLACLVGGPSGLGGLEPSDPDMFCIPCVLSQEFNLTVIKKYLKILLENV